MPHEYEALTLGSHRIDRITDAEHGLRFDITRHGAELVSLCHRNPRGEWEGFLHRDGELDPPTQGWGNHATVMGYYVHRLLDGHTLYRGQTMEGGTHSFIRHLDFAAPEVKGGALTYRVTRNQIPAGAYPYDVSLALTYSAEAGRLKAVFAFENHEAEPSHVSFGLHPGFRVSDTRNAEVHLPAGTWARLLAPGNFLSGEEREFHHPGGAHKFPADELEDSFLLEPREVESRHVTLHDPGSGHRVTLDLGSAPYLTIWSSGSDFLCVEPCWGLPDHHEQRPFEQKLGIQEIPAGGTLEASCTIEPGFL